MSVPRPPSISAESASDAASSGVIQVTSSASCRGSQVPVTGTTKSERDGVLTVVVVRRDARHRKVFGDGERRGLGRNLRECRRPEVILEVPVQRIAHRLAVPDAPRHDSARELADARRAQQDADLGDLAGSVG